MLSNFSFKRIWLRPNKFSLFLCFAAVLGRSHVWGKRARQRFRFTQSPSKIVGVLRVRPAPKLELQLHHGQWRHKPACKETKTRRGRRINRKSDSETKQKKRNLPKIIFSKTMPKKTTQQNFQSMFAKTFAKWPFYNLRFWPHLQNF